MTPALLDGFDSLLLDLDGVVYVGLHAVPHASSALRGCRDRGVSCVFVTNNAARSTAEVAGHLTDLGIEAEAIDVVTSPQAAVSLLPGYVSAGAAVLVIGGRGIVEALEEAGYRAVSSLDDHPDAVMQGYSPDLTWRDLAEASFAVSRGLPWIATNPDLTFPSPRGIAPGNGALVRVVAETTGRQPDAVAGKPEPPLLRTAMQRSGGTRPLMVGDRLDTDIEAATRVGIPSLLVLTGVTDLDGLINAVAAQRPTFVGADLRALLEPYPEVARTAHGASCGDWTAVVDAGTLVVSGPTATAIDGVRAACAAVWDCADRGVLVATGSALTMLAGEVSVGVG